MKKRFTKRRPFWMCWGSRTRGSHNPSFTPAFLNGPGVFETIRLYGGVAAGLELHLDRLEASARTAGIHLPSRAVILKRFRAATTRSGLGDAIARLSVHAPAFGRTAFAGRETMMGCSVRPFGGCPRGWYAHGVRVVTAAVRRPGPRESAAQVKGNDYLNALSGILSGPAAATAAPVGSHAPGANPLFLTESGSVSENATANLLILKTGVLWTPPTACGILLGVTRGIVLDAAAEIGLTVRESAFTRHDVYNADEVFLTNAAVEVLPVVEADRRRIGDGRPGPWAPRLRAAYLSSCSSR